LQLFLLVLHHHHHIFVYLEDVKRSSYKIQSSKRKEIEQW